MSTLFNAPQTDMIAKALARECDAAIEAAAQAHLEQLAETDPDAPPSAESLFFEPTPSNTVATIEACLDYYIEAKSARDRVLGRDPENSDTVARDFRRLAEATAWAIARDRLNRDAFLTPAQRVLAQEDRASS